MAASVTLVLMAATGLAVWTLTRPETLSPALERFAVVPPDDAPLSFGGLATALAVSPTGRYLVYVGPDPETSGPRLNLRSLDQLEVRTLRGSEGGLGPFFSPAGDSVGFTDLDGTTLSKVSIDGGPAVTLAELPRAAFGATWGLDDNIILGTVGGGLLQVPGEGGSVEELTAPEPGGVNTSHTWPFRIPGHETVLFVTSEAEPLRTGELAALDLASGEIVSLGLSGFSPRYVDTGHLVYAAADGTVRAVPFDVTTLTTSGSPVPLVEGVHVRLSGAAAFDIAANDGPSGLCARHA